MIERLYVKTILKTIGILFVVFLVSIIVVNVAKPAFQQEVDEEYKEYISKLNFEDNTLTAERVLNIEDNEEALLWRLRMIADAKETIVLATFDLRADESGTDVMAALYDAAERGVKVQLLVDGIYQLLYLRDCDTFDALCMHENVDARFYNRVNLSNIYKVNYRMHDKYLMIDDRMYLLGGRNTTDTFIGNREYGTNVDREVLVINSTDGKGESFLQLRKYFEQIWSESCVEKIEPSLKQSVLDKEKDLFVQRYEHLQEEYDDIKTYDRWLEDTFEADKITLLSNGTHAGNKVPNVLYAIDSIASSGQDVVIQTPYVICNEEMYDVLSHISKNATVNIFINAVERGSNPWGCCDYLNNKTKVLNTGTNVYEVMNEVALHTKAVLVDENISIIGSFNYDMRSAYIDTELMLVIDSKELNSRLRDVVEGYVPKSIEVLSDGNETIGPLYEKKELSTKKEIMYGVLRVIIRPFRYLL